jgi:hypothetical protein
MQVSPCPGHAMNKAARPAAVRRIILHNLTCLESLQHFVNRDGLFCHLLMRVLGDANILRGRLRMYSLSDGAGDFRIRCPCHAADLTLTPIG